jgi:hypothetical protein
VSRPRFIDYFLMLCGAGLSVLLAEWSEVRVTAGDASRPGPAFVKVLPYLLFLPQGIILLWPIFYATQRAGGRDVALAAGEWVWGLAWLAAVLLVSWIAWKQMSQPEVDTLKKTAVLAYILFVLTAAVIAVIVAFVDMVGRWPQPWTHTFCLVLMIWSALPLAALWIWNLKLE